MSVPAGFQDAARLRLREVSEHLNRSHREQEALRSADVSEQRIAALYPFDWEDWREAAELLSENAGYFENDGHFLLSRPGMSDVVDSIPLDTVVGDAERIQALASSWMGDSPYQVARFARLELALRLLHTLAGPSFELVHPNRAAVFKLRTQDLLDDAEAFCEQLNERTELFEDSSF